ncbi:TolC family protein [Persicitalea jodogahamensis]|uniref:TolC family protein n=1 Tax=Persicitalea jodogahamensis TaxID=402147 RepID=UPI001676F893|nr:TolC family protein [Persicitalea jodogahamensis]
MKRYFSYFLFLVGWSVQAQSVVTLEQCYEAARANYPLLKQKEILARNGELAIGSLNLNRQLPQLALNGQATWQSQVTKLPIELPNFSIPTLSKDQYRLTLDASYALYDGNLSQLQTEVQRASTATAQQQVEIELNRLKDQVNGLFLNALLTDENRVLTRALLANLENRLEKLRANVRFGTVAQMDADALEAELLTAGQRLAQLDATRTGLRESLALLTDLPISDSTQLVVEEVPNAAGGVGTAELGRPELQLYRAQRSLYDAQFQLSGNKAKPRLSLFAQGGAGRPGLNMLSNDFRSFFIGGLRLNWNLSSAYTLNNDRQMITLNRQTVDIQQATFEKNLSVQLRQQQTEIDKLAAQLAADAEIVALRSRVREAAAVQLDNGAIAARDYTTELNAENQAQLNQKLHELQLLLARIQYRTLMGN